MKLLSAAQMRALDGLAMEGAGIPSTLLMTNAAKHVADAVLGLCAGAGPVSVFAGTGNNGGDGIAVARLLLRQGVPARVFLVGDRSAMTPDCREMERRLNEDGGIVETFDPDCRGICDFIADSSVLVDALFGVGLCRAVTGAAERAVRLMNAASAPVVAVDIPSGIEADTGRVLGAAVRADRTVTFTYAKPGHFTAPGLDFCGALQICDIGIPREIYDAAATDIQAVTEICLPRRALLSHKGDYGRALIIAGSAEYTGAASFAARGAERAGAGLVFLGVPAALHTIAALTCGGAMPFMLPCTVEGRLSADAVAPVLRRLEDCSACLIGPGLGRSPALSDLIFTVIRKSRVPLVLDADGINAVTGNINILHEAKCPVILTPHDGEFKRLGGRMDGGRIAAAADFARQYGCTLVLKGPGTVTATPGGRIFVNTTGNPGMAKGGTGDVLAGVLLAFLSGGASPEEAATRAVFLHGAAGDRCRDALGEHSITPEDLIGALADVCKLWSS